MRRLFKWLGCCLLAVLLLVVVALLLVRFTSPWALRHTGFLSQLLSRQLGVPVQLQGAKIQWHGTTAIITVDQVAIRANKSAQPALSWQQLSIQGDGWHLLQNKHWVLDRLAWQHATAVLSFDKQNQLQLGYPGQPLHLKSTGPSHFNWRQSPLTQHSELALQDTDVQLLRSPQQKTHLQIGQLAMSANKKHHVRLRWKLAGQTHWQQANAAWKEVKSGGPIHIHFPLKQWDISPLLTVLSQKKQPFKPSVISWQSSWTRKGAAWSGGWRNLQVSVAWGSGKHLQIKDGTGVLVDHNPEWVIEMLWPAIRMNKQQLPKQASELRIHQHAGHNRLQFDLPDLELKQWVPFLLAALDGKAEKTVRDLRPTGVIKAPRLQVDWGKQTEVKLSAAADRISWAASQSAPGFHNLSAKLTYDWLRQTAAVSLAINNGTFNWPAMFEAKWQDIVATGSIGLAKSTAGWRISFNQLDYRDVDVSLQAKGSLQFDSQFANPYFDWSADFSVSDLAHVKHYLPYKMAPHTRMWLKRGFQKGVVQHATMSWVGPLQGFPYQHNEGQWHLYSPVTDLSLFYKPGWPRITETEGQFYMDNTAIRFSASTANLSDNVITNAVGKIPDVDHPILSVQGQSNTQLQTIQHFMNISPLPWKRDLQVVKLSGPAQADIHLRADVSKKNGDVSLKGTLKLAAATVDMPMSNIRISDTTGLLGFTEQGIVGKQLAVRVLGGPAKVDIKTQRQADNSTLLILDANGQLSMQGLNKQMPFELLHYFHGLTPYHAHLLYGDLKNPARNQFSLQTSMQGARVDLPAPFHKKAAAQLPVKFAISLAENKPTDFSLNYGSLVQAIIRLQHQGQHSVFQTGAVVIGSKMPKLPKNSGLQLSGVLDKVDAKAWSPILSPFFESDTGVDAEGQKHGVAWSSIDLLFKQLYWGKNDYSTVTLFASPSVQGWTIKFNSPYGSGSALFPKIKTQDWVLSFKNFNWKPVFEKELKQSAKKHGKTINWANVPPLTVFCEKCRYGKTAFGGVGAWFKVIKKGRYQLKTNWAYKGLYLTATMQWGSKSPLQFVGRLVTNDLSAFVNTLSEKHYVDQGEGTVNLNLTWPKSPFDFALPAVSGQVGVKLANVRFIHLPKKMKTGLGIAKLVNILSIQNSLPFVNIAKKGFFVHRLAFTGDMLKSTLSTTDFIIHSPVVNVEANGQINLKKDTIKMQLSLEPQVTGSLPIIAAIAGGPLAGVLAYALNQVVEPLVGKAVAMHYTVSGQLANPAVKQSQASAP
jgi:uncharacterized protein (TIGR02099 family)